MKQSEQKQYIYEPDIYDCVRDPYDNRVIVFDTKEKLMDAVVNSKGFHEWHRKGLKTTIMELETLRNSITDDEFNNAVEEEDDGVIDALLDFAFFLLSEYNEYRFLTMEDKEYYNKYSDMYIEREDISDTFKLAKNSKETPDEKYYWCIDKKDFELDNKYILNQLTEEEQKEFNSYEEFSIDKMKLEITAALRLADKLKTELHLDEVEINKEIFESNMRGLGLSNYVED